MKNQKGITLIALVITIIVLLILAGISIAMLTGDNGLVTKFKEGAAASAVAGAKDEVALEFQAKMSTYLQDKYTPGSTPEDIKATEVVTGVGNKTHDCKVVGEDTENTITISYPSTGTADYSTVGTISKDDKGNYTLTWSK